MSFDSHLGILGLADGSSPNQCLNDTRDQTNWSIYIAHLLKIENHIRQWILRWLTANQCTFDTQLVKLRLWFTLQVPLLGIHQAHSQCGNLWAKKRFALKKSDSSYPAYSTMWPGNVARKVWKRDASKERRHTFEITLSCNLMTVQFLTVAPGRFNSQSHEYQT